MHAPLLLVSVRDAHEARAALAGGCDILDVKEPDRGSLGMADPDTIADVLRLTVDASRPVPVTAALGELCEWSDRRETPPLPRGLAFVKLGLARAGTGDWIARWSRIRRRFDESAGHPLRWIAVAYADWQSAAAPPPEAVIAAAIQTRCAGVLFDTHGKHGGTLPDLIDARRLTHCAESIQATGLIVALAGGLTQASLPAIHACRPDVIAIRGAACANGHRTGPLTAAAVQSFRAQLHTTFHESRGTGR